MDRILIVEDEEIIRTALRKLLQKNGFEVTEAASIPEARQQALDSFQLIISDQRLPGGEGTELIARAGETPVLIMTSYASMRSAVDAMKLGAVDYIAKPFDHKEMIETVMRILKQNSPETPDETAEGPASLDDYFIRFVQENEQHLSETELAKRLGISRKGLWERRQKLGIPRKK